MEEKTEDKEKKTLVLCSPLVAIGAQIELPSPPFFSIFCNFDSHSVLKPHTKQLVFDIFCKWFVKNSQQGVIYIGQMGQSFCYTRINQINRDASQVEPKPEIPGKSPDCKTQVILAKTWVPKYL